MFVVEGLYYATRGEREKLPKLLGDRYIYFIVLDSMVCGVRGLLLARGQHSGFTISPTLRILCPINNDFIQRWFEKLHRVMHTAACNLAWRISRGLGANTSVLARNRPGTVQTFRGRYDVSWT